MDINKGSLFELKAELIRKRREVESAKTTIPGCVKPTPKVKLQTISDKVNSGVARREQLDKDETETGDLLGKSQEILQRKAKLYEKLHADSTDVGDSGFLVNFAGKEKKPTENVSDEFEDENDSDWVDYVDTFGRTRRCLKEDLSKMLPQEPAVQVRPLTPDEKCSDGGCNKEELTDPELVKREFLRKKWEEQELENLGAKDVHYQDLLFDVYADGSGTPLDGLTYFGPGVLNLLTTADNENLVCEHCTVEVQEGKHEPDPELPKKSRGGHGGLRLPFSNTSPEINQSGLLFV